jgi:hypothetical protein
MTMNIALLLSDPLTPHGGDTAKKDNFYWKQDNPVSAVRSAATFSMS